MQYKKENVRQKIIDVGKKEYLENGFRGANIKVIAEKAGVPVGNLYRYFDGKNGLLDAIVSNVYNEIPDMIIRLAQLFMSHDLPDFEKLVPMFTDNALKLFDMYNSELLILMYRCEKTKYGDFPDKLVSIVEGLIKNYMTENPSGDQCEFIKLISRNFISSLFDLLKADYDQQKLRILMSKLLRFTFGDINDRL